MIPFIVSPEGEPLLNTKNTPAPSREVAEEPTSMADLIKAAQAEARKQSTERN